MREDSCSKFVELSKAKEACYLNYLQKIKTYYMRHLRRLDSTDYDKTFANAYEDFVDEDGIYLAIHVIFVQSVTKIYER